MQPLGDIIVHGDEHEHEHVYVYETVCTYALTH